MTTTQSPAGRIYLSYTSGLPWVLEYRVDRWSPVLLHRFGTYSQAEKYATEYGIVTSRRH